MAERPSLLFRAFADETRLRILHLLSSGERCVGDLVAILQLPQPSVSRHLAYLRRAGLVEARRSGAWQHYRLARPRVALHRRLLACVRGCLAGLPEMAADRRRAAGVKAAGGCCPAGRRRDVAAAGRARR